MMRDTLGVLFIIITTGLSLMLAYSIGQGVIGNYGWFGVALGILLSTLMAGRIAFWFIKGH